MSNFAVDGNRNIAAIRVGALIGGIHGRTGANITTNAWYRLMPSIDNASKAANNPTGIDLGGLRADVFGSDISGWNLRVLTSGYEALYTISEYDDISEIASLEIYGGNGNISDTVARLPANFDVVYYPQMLLPLTLGYSTTSTTSTVIDIGYTKEDAVTPTSTVPLVSLANGDQLILPIQAIDKVFWRVPNDQVDTDVYSISWGEHYVS